MLICVAIIGIIVAMKNHTMHNILYHIVSKDFYDSFYELEQIGQPWTRQGQDF